MTPDIINPSSLFLVLCNCDDLKCCLTHLNVLLTFLGYLGICLVILRWSKLVVDYFCSSDSTLYHSCRVFNSAWPEVMYQAKIPTNLPSEMWFAAYLCSTTGNHWNLDYPREYSWTLIQLHLLSQSSSIRLGSWGWTSHCWQPEVFLYSTPEQSYILHVPWHHVCWTYIYE